MARNSLFSAFPEIVVFLEQMNRNAARLNLKSSMYDSPHGMANPMNRSTAFDCAKLGAVCMKNDFFCKVVSTVR